MPIYTYKHPDKEEYMDVMQKMNDRHVYIDDDGVEWRRIWSVPSLSVGLNLDADSSQQFVDKTEGWTTGDMWDYSGELSEKRKSKRGYDHIGEAQEKKRQGEIDYYKEKNREKRLKGAANPPPL